MGSGYALSCGNHLQIFIEAVNLANDCRCALALSYMLRALEDNFVNLFKTNIDKAPSTRVQ